MMPQRLPPFRKLKWLREWLNELHEHVQEITPLGSDNVRVFRTPRGTSFVAVAAKEAEPEEAIIGIQRFRIVNKLADALLCEALTGNTVEERVYVAKPDYLRRTGFHHDEAPEVDDEDYSDPWYSYSDDNDERTAHFANGTFYREVMEPLYHDSDGGAEGDVIIGLQVEGGIPDVTIPGIAVEWVDANVDARHFDLPIQLTGFCIDGRPYTAYLRRGDIG